MIRHNFHPQRETGASGRAWFAPVLAFFLACGLTAAHAEEAGKIVLAVGETRMAGKLVKEGEGVSVGAELSTGADGYLYLKTVDNGFLILRPGSTATIEAYQIDKANPGQSRFKFTLHKGVARNISGEAVGKARENFRFNTPVAAIGVRGTDFSVYADERETRVAVISGGVIVSGFDARCSPHGAGPCEGGRELFAGTSSVLQVQKGYTMPRILKGDALSPDLVAPRRSDEPGTTTPSTSPAGDGNAAPAEDGGKAESSESSNAEIIALQKPENSTTPDPMKPEHSPIIWGRWQTISEQLPATVEVPPEGKYVQISLGSYILLRDKDSSIQTPSSGGVSFVLQDSLAHVTDPLNKLEAPASLRNGSLSFDFAKAAFSTKADLNALGQTHSLYASGQVATDGIFYNDAKQPESNMIVRGALFKDKQGLSAGYLFQSQLENGWKANGATSWK
ncbi:MAG: FecR family protein [Zoogloeaceae bacterium]|jgi:hypothetical protein|nr:FecR family protein [Zoogloeaceae bacterium]